MSGNDVSIETITQLAANLEELAISSISSNKNNRESSISKYKHDVSPLVPSLQQFYQMGLLLFQTTKEGNNDTSNSNQNSLVIAYRHFIESIPETLLCNTFYQFHLATSKLLDKKLNLEVLIPTCQSLHGLFTQSPRLCRVVYTKEWVSALALIYDQFILGKQHNHVKNVVLSCLSFLLLDGLFLDVPTSPKQTQSAPGPKPLEESLLEAIQSIDEQSTDCLRDLQLWQKQHEPFRRTLTTSLQQHRMTSNDDDQDHNDDDERIQQREYILNMLESASEQPLSQPSSQLSTIRVLDSKPNRPLLTVKTSPADELNRRIQQVKQILPHLGEGFIEVALSLYQADVENTVATLLNDPSEYPTSLQVLDMTLPRRKKEHDLQDDQAKAAEARQIVKERIALEEEKEVARYNALLYVTQRDEQQAETDVRRKYNDEYDDDYDDQYDEMDIRLGSTDDGFTTDRDFEQVRLYNKLVRDDEAEDLFWEDNRNFNRDNQSRSKSPKGPNPDDNGGQKQYRGQDKIKGGRVVGPDGKIVKKPGGARKSNNYNNGHPLPPKKQTQDENTKNTSAAVNNQMNSQKPKGKPRTKPKSDNRVNRQRDRKQRNQSTFGVQE
jgi:hypothetical protein